MKTVLAPRKMVQKKASVPFCKGADAQTLDIVWICLLSFASGLCWSQDSERSFHFSETTLTLTGKIKVLTKILWLSYLWCWD